MRKSSFFQLILYIAAFFVLLYGRWNVSHVSGERSPDAALKMNQEIPVRYAEYSIGFLDSEFPSVSELEREADVIVRASVLDKRTMSARSTRTEICVNEILALENADFSVGDVIYLIEPVTFLRGELYDTNGYQMAHTGEEHIFLLKHLECVDGYRYTEEQEKTYMPVSVYYAKYASSYDEITKPLGDKEVFYDEIRDYAILTDSVEVISQYEALKDQIKEKYGEKENRNGSSTK